MLILRVGMAADVAEHAYMSPCGDVCTFHVAHICVCGCAHVISELSMH